MKNVFERFAGNRPLLIAHSADISDESAASADFLRLTIDDVSNEAIVPAESLGGRRLSLEDILEAYPDKCFNFDLRGKFSAAPFCDFLKRSDISERIIVSSPHGKNLKMARKLAPAAATSFSAFELMWMYWLYISGFVPLVKKFAAEAIVPQFAGGSERVNYSFIKQISQKGIRVFIHEPEGNLQRLIDSGAGGFIVSDCRYFEKILGDL